MRKLVARFARQSVPHLVRVACLLALVALGLMVFGIIFPKPIHIILSMSLGHLVCVAAAGTYGLAVLLDATDIGKPPAGASPRDRGSRERSRADVRTPEG